jgi:NlpC/P60 family protein
MRRQIRYVMVGITVLSLLLVQNVAADGNYSTGLHPLSAREGRGIVLAAARQEGAEAEGRTEDCSHLVHDLYEQAGYPYPYASSFDLYNGSKSFVRVTKPQPGDLIVWRGHVGIVVDQREHSFFSSVSSGPQTEYYNSPYWRGRGRARFYRYLTGRRSKGESATTERASSGPEQEPVAPGARGRSVPYGPTLEEVKMPPTKVTAVAARSGEGADSGKGAAVAPKILLHISGKQPMAADVAQGLAEANHDAGEILRAGNLEQLGRPVIIYEDLRVTGVEIKGKRGSARVQIDCVALLAGGRMEPRRDGEQLGLELQRMKKGWVMHPANENTYVPRDAALRILAARLASLTQREDASALKEREQAQIIRLLNLLVEEN